MKRYTILAEDGFPMSYEEGVEKTEIVQDTEGNWVRWDDVERLKSSHAELLKALKELYYTVQGECPSLLDEDSGGSGYLDIEISNAIANAEGTK